MLDDVKRRAGPFEGDGQVASFPFSFRIFSDDDVKVVTSVKGEAATSVLQKDVDYTVTVNADQDATPGGTVVLGSALAKGYVLSIISDLAYTQEVQLTNYSRFPPQILNDGLDRNVLLIQQLKEQVDRTIVVPPTSNETPEELLEEILDVAAKANEYVERAEEIRDEVQDRHEEIVGIRDHVDEQAAKVDAAMDDIAQAAEDAISEIGSEAEKKVGELNETTENLKSALGVTKNDLAAELTAHASNETRIATQEIAAAKETAIANADERITNRENIAVSNVNSVASAGVEAVNQTRDAALGEVGNYVNAAQQQASSAQQSANSAIQAASNAQQAASNAQSSASASAQSAQSASYSASSADSSMRSASDYASQSSNSASSSASSASKAAQSAASAEESAKTASFSVRYGQAAYANSSIQAADLVPSVNVKVGDHVINGDGELFLIDSVKNGAVHVGDVIVTLKGKDGAGLTLNGEFGSYNDLVATRPVGQPGDAYLIQGDLWYWAEDDNAWKNAGPFRGPQGVRGPQGFTFTPIMASDGTLSWSNNGGLENPASKNLTGPRGYHYTPSVDGSGNLSWSNDGDLVNPASKNIRGPRGFTFTPSVDDKSNLSWSNDGDLANPATKNIRGYHFTPAVDGKGNLSWTNNGELENPATKNIRGYHFTPAVDGKGNLSWTNNGDLDNPATQNIRGYHYTPSVDDNGNISWTNNGDLDNPATKNIRGPQGFTFTPSVSAEGIISWSNDGGLANPSPVDIKGPCIVGVDAVLANTFFTKAEWDAIIDAGEMKLLEWDIARVRVGDMMRWTGLWQGGVAGVLPFEGIATVTAIDKTNSKVSFKDGALMFGMTGLPGKDGTKVIRVNPTSGLERTFAQWQNWCKPGTSVGFSVYQSDDPLDFGGDYNNPNVGDVIVFNGVITDAGNAPITVFLHIQSHNYGKNPGQPVSITAKIISGVYSGVRGEQGVAGAVFTPSVDADGNLTWTNNGDLANPAKVNIRGPQGIQGPQGPKGDGLNYEDLTPEQIKEIKGPQGPRGYHFTPSVNANGDLSWSNNGDLTNPSTVNIRGPQGIQGIQGIQGERGKEGSKGDNAHCWAIQRDVVVSVTLSEVMNGYTSNISGIKKESFDFDLVREGDLVCLEVIVEDKGNVPGVVIGTLQDWTFTGDTGSITYKMVNCLYGTKGDTGATGPKGDTGATGLQGEQGVQGVQGPKGNDGAKGATFTPNVDADGNISWTNDAGLTNPPAINIRGPQGPAIEVDTSNLVPKTGNRGELAGYETASFVGADLTATEVTPPDVRINENSPDIVSVIGANVIVENGTPQGLLDWVIQSVVFENVTEYPTNPCTSWTKVVLINMDNIVSLGSLWRWKDNVVPTIMNGLLLLNWHGDYGTACFIDTDEAFNEIVEEKIAELG